jgi:hypothetical protein
MLALVNSGSHNYIQCLHSPGPLALVLLPGEIPLCRSLVKALSEKYLGVLNPGDLLEHLKTKWHMLNTQD